MDLNNATQQNNTTPAPSSGAVNPNDLVTISNSKTGEIKKVKRQDLASYGLPMDYQSPADTYAEGIIGNSGMALTSVPDRYKAATTSVLNQKGYVDPSTPVGKQQAADKSASNTARSLMQSTLQNYQDVPADQKGIIMGKKADIPIIGGMVAPKGAEYESGLKGEAASLGKVFGGAGSGLRITQPELNSWMPWFPSIHKTDAQNAADVQKLDNVIRGRFGQGFDDPYLQEFGLARDKNGHATLASNAPAATSTTPGQPNGNQSAGLDVANAVGDNIKNGVGGFVKNFLGTAQNDMNDIVAGIVSQHGQKGLDQADKTASQMEQMAQQTKDPQQKKVLLSQANTLRSAISAQAGQEGKNFSPDVNANPLLRAGVGATQVVTAADALAHPVALTKAITSPLAHPIQTAKNVINLAKDPAGALTAFLKHDYATSFGGNLPGASKVAGGIPVSEAVGTPSTGSTPTGTGAAQPPNPQVDKPTNPQIGTQPAATQPAANGQPAVASQPPTTQPPATGNPNGLSAREQLAKRFATSVAVPNPNSVTQSENTMQKAFAMTRGNDPRTIARELEADIPQAGKVITAHAANLDGKVGMQPLSAPDNTGVLDQIMAEVNKTTPARANPEMATKFQNELQGLLHSGTFGQEGATRGVTDGTTFTKMNDARKYLTSNKSSWFANGQPVGTPTNDQNAMDWAAANAMKRIMGEGDSSGVFKQMLDRQHTALEAAPALAQATLKDDKMNTVGTMVRKGVNAVADRVGLRTVVPRNTNPLPTIDATPPTMANGEAPLAATSVSNAAPMATSNQPLQGAETTLPNNQKIQFDRRTAQGNTQPTKGSQQLLAATSPSYLRKLAKK